MNKNPFSIYDFLGYLFPGAFALIVVKFLVYTDNPFCPYCFLESIRDLAQSNDKLTDTIFFILLSYILGHAIAFASTLTVEQFANWRYGYPSSFILGISTQYLQKPTYPANMSLRGKAKVFMRYYLARTFVALSVWPICLFSIVIGQWLNVRKFYIKETDEFTKKEILKRIQRLTNKLGIENISEDMINEKQLNYHRFITFYEYEKSEKHGVKMDNYVALYDFMRSVTMVLVFYTWYVAIMLVVFWGIDAVSLLYVIGAAFSTYFFFMAYMKFYRRYTEESFYTLVADDDFKESVAGEINNQNQDQENNNWEGNGQ